MADFGFKVLVGVMNNLNYRLLAAVAVAMMLSACSSVKVWPFGGDEVATVPGAPANSTAYFCEKNKKFYVRMLDNGATAWVILPEREFALAKSGSTFSNGVSTLTVQGQEATLVVTPENTYSGCSVPAPVKK
jgi:membrane-bound inhibitor of C-type lysozyme